MTHAQKAAPDMLDNLDGNPAPGTFTGTLQ
jgi:hypothetical protein